MKRFMYALNSGTKWVVRDHLLGRDICHLDDAKHADIICNALNAAAEAGEIA